MFTNCVLQIDSFDFHLMSPFPPNVVFALHCFANSTNLKGIIDLPNGHAGLLFRYWK